MKITLFIVLLVCGARLSNAQRPVERHIIVCINFVDSAGKPLQPEDNDAVEIETFPDLSHYSRGVDDFSETMRQSESDSSFHFEPYAGKPSRIGQPFAGGHYVLSGVLREFVVTRPGKAYNEGMRIILLNHNRPAADGRVPVYFMENIVFRPGTYEVDCRRFAASEMAVYDNRVPLQLFYMNRQPRKKSLPAVKPAAFGNYRIDDFTFYKDGLFKYSGYGSEGNGRHQLTPWGITLFYTPAAGKKPVPTAMPYDSTARPVNSIEVRVTDDKDGTPVPGAIVKYKGTRQAAATNGNGLAYINLPSNALGQVLEIMATGYEARQMQLAGPGNYKIECILSRNYIHFIDSGTVQKAVFTDFSKDYLGIYWLNPDETFSLDNQEQMSRRVFYEHKRFRPLPRVFPD